MTQGERILLASLAQALLQKSIDFTFYKQKSGAGEMDPTGHPDYAALVQRFAPLTTRLEKPKAPEGSSGPEEDVETLLKEVLKAAHTLR